MLLDFTGGAFVWDSTYAHRLVLRGHGHQGTTGRRPNTEPFTACLVRVKPQGYITAPSLVLAQGDSTPFDEYTLNYWEVNAEALGYNEDTYVNSFTLKLQCMTWTNHEARRLIVLMDLTHYVSDSWSLDVRAMYPTRPYTALNQREPDFNLVMPTTFELTDWDVKLPKMEDFIPEKQVHPGPPLEATPRFERDVLEDAS